MHGIHGTLARRLEAVARRLGALQPPETPDETARRLELIRAAHAGREPEDLEPHKRPVFARIAASLPILRELLEDGTVDADGEPAGADPHRDLDDDLDDDDAPAWVP